MKPDVIILGGGPNGLAAALSLGSHTLPRPLRVLLLDRRDPRIIPNDSRGTALTLTTQSMFQALGVWQYLAQSATEMRDILVTDGNGPHDTRPSLLHFKTESNLPAAASMVANGDLASALLRTVEQSPSITLQGGFTLERFEVRAGRVTLSGQTGETYAAPLLIAADGRNSAVRTQLAIPLTRHDYKQTALSFSISHSLPHNNTAEEHFAPDGVFAFLPLRGQTASIVWGMAPDRAHDLMALDDTTFNATLQSQLGHRVGGVSLLGSRTAYPLSMQMAQRMTSPRIMLLGDAAHAIHPLAGLGLNLGFKDAAVLADCVMQAFARGEDVGGASVLEAYQLARRFETTATSLAMDGMNALFANENAGLKALRNAGLRVVNNVPALKTMLMAQAAGTSQENPRLLQGLLPG